MAGYNLTTLKVVDFNNAEGKKISDLQTNFNDCSLVDFHHNLTDLADLILIVSIFLNIMQETVLLRVDIIVIFSHCLFATVFYSKIIC